MKKVLSLILAVALCMGAIITLASCKGDKDSEIKVNPDNVFFFVGILVGQTITILNIGIINAVRHHIHSADTEHCSVHIVAVEHIVHIVVLLLTVIEDFRKTLFFEIISRRNKKARRTASRIANHVVCRG